MRVTLVLVVFVIVGCGRDKPDRAEPTYRAFRKIAAATATGVNKVTFDALLQDAAGELLVYRDLSGGTSDTVPATLYVEALQKYQDAATLWGDQISDARYDWIPEGRIYLIRESIAARYKLERTEHQMPYTKTTFETVPQESIQKIWELASTDADSANHVVLGRLKARYR